MGIGERAAVDLERAREKARRFDGPKPNGEGAPGDWRDLLHKRGERYVGDERNVLLSLRHAPALDGLLRFNEFAAAVEFTRRPPWRDTVPATWTDDDDVQLQAWLQAQAVDVRQRGTVADCVATVAKDRAVHPLRSHLSELTWDGRDRLNTWLVEYLDAGGPADYLEAVGRRFLLQSVARIFQPGCQADHVLVLEGPQGCGKSRTARALALQAGWFTDGMPDLHGKDAALQLAGRWIVELAELAAIRRTADLEAVKAFISRPVDVYRPPYGRRTVAVPRQCVFIGSTNEHEYLRDQTGNRRFWPVRVGRIDLAELEHEAPQLWAEAVARYRAGEPWHLTGEEAELAALEQAERRLVTELEERVTDYLVRMSGQGHNELAIRSVLVDGCGLDPTAPDFVERAGRLGPQVSHAMRQQGWHRVGAVGRGSDRRVLYRRA